MNGPYNRWWLVLALLALVAQACDGDSRPGRTDTSPGDTPQPDTQSVDAPTTVDTPTADGDTAPSATVDTTPDTATEPDVPADAPDAASPALPPITIRGYAFAFAGHAAPLEGVAIHIAEHHEIHTVSSEDGSYTLEVPDGEPFTPVAELPGYRTMYLQTFTAAGEDLINVSFQMVETWMYDVFSYALEIEPLDDHCQISTTVNTKDIREMTLEDFAAYGAHGVPGVVVWSEPALADMVYFDAQTIPDRTLTETTADGGVVWPNVPPGVYVMKASHPDKTFAPFVATCEPGRFINAGPPWGLREE